MENQKTEAQQTEAQKEAQQKDYSIYDIDGLNEKAIKKSNKIDLFADGLKEKKVSVKKEYSDGTVFKVERQYNPKIDDNVKEEIDSKVVIRQYDAVIGAVLRINNKIEKQKLTNEYKDYLI